MNTIEYFKEQFRAIAVADKDNGSLHAIRQNAFNAF